jgi:hypothetical protein
VFRPICPSLLQAAAEAVVLGPEWLERMVREHTLEAAVRLCFACSTPFLSLLPPTHGQAGLVDQCVHPIIEHALAATVTATAAGSNAPATPAAGDTRLSVSVQGSRSSSDGEAARPYKCLSAFMAQVCVSGTEAASVESGKGMGLNLPFHISVQLKDSGIPLKPRERMTALEKYAFRLLIDPDEGIDRSLHLPLAMVLRLLHFVTEAPGWKGTIPIPASVRQKHEQGGATRPTSRSKSAGFYKAVIGTVEGGHERALALLPPWSPMGYRAIYHGKDFERPSMYDIGDLSLEDMKGREPAPQLYTAVMSCLARTRIACVT